MEIVILIIGAALGAVFSVIAAVLFQDTISDFLISKLSWIMIRRSVDLSGVWNQDWQVDGSTTNIDHSKTSVVLKQLGARVYGTFGFEEREYIFRGRLESGAYLNGEWYDSQSGPGYSGAFQLRVAANAKSMKGKWVGFSDGDTKLIRTGPWAWRRPAEKQPAEQDVDPNA